MLRDTARSFLEAKAPSETVRALMETDTGFDEALWAEMAEMGWPAMHIPEEYGGFGFGHVELNIVFEELGRSLVPAPLFATVALGANALLEAGTEEQKAAVLPGVASGEVKLALAHAEADGSWDAGGIAMTAKRDGGEFVLDGEKSFVIDGHVADQLVVAARTDAGVSLFLVDAGAAGLVTERLETMDMTRKQARLSFESVRVPEGSLLGEDGAGEAMLERVLRLAVVSLANEQVGGAARCLEMAVEFAKVRKQFGRSIGSFQAIKHRCADMLMRVESAKSAAYHAGRAADEDPEELLVAAPLAKSYCSDAYLWVAGENIQVHGGIGFTWEHDAHLYFKRAKSSQLLFGDSAHHRARLADQLGL